MAAHLTDSDKAAGKSRHTAAEILDHYQPLVEKIRANHGKAPYANWNRSYRNWTTYEMSDHLPIWMELEVDYSDDYLRRYL